MPKVSNASNARLIPMILASDSKKKIEVSASDVAHFLTEGARIVDAAGKDIPPRRIPVRQTPKGKIVYDLGVIDPGPQFPYAFDPKAEEKHLVMVYKA